MINEITAKITNLDVTQKVENQNNSREETEKRGGKQESYQINDTVDLSGKQPSDTTIEPVNLLGREAHDLSDAYQQGIGNDKNAAPHAQGTEKEQNAGKQSSLTDEERKELEELNQRDEEVRRHEQAHVAAAGVYAQGVSFEYQAGPDGKRYAVGGEVSIDTSPVPDNPDATIAKARTIRAAANAPADPSSQDRQVAAAAARMEAAARAEKMEEATQEDREGTVPSLPDNSSIDRNTDEPVKDILSNEVNSLVESLTSAYGKKETEIGRLINKTV